MKTGVQVYNVHITGTGWGGMHLTRWEGDYVLIHWAHWVAELVNPRFCARKLKWRTFEET